MKKSSIFYVKLKLLQFLNIIIAVVGFYLAYKYDKLNLLWVSFAVLMYQTLNAVCFLHRFFAHRSFKVSKWIEIVASISVIFAAFGSTIAWVAVHRVHHKETDKPGDPHSPYVNHNVNKKLSLWKAFKIWILFLDKSKIPYKYTKPLSDQPFHVFLHKQYFKIVLTTYTILGIIDPWLVVFIFAIPACFLMFSLGSLASLGHIHGYKTYELDNEARNSWIVSIFTLGDGWHNNHHAKPNKWTTQEKWWEFDPAGWLIWLIKK